VSSPLSAADEKALALYNVLGARYRVSGDSATRLEDVRAMKQVVLDSRVSLAIRANMLNMLAAQYSLSGADPAVSAEVFADAPFNQYYEKAADDDRTARLSARKLFEWSYGMKPTSFAAINIARWYSEQPAFNPGLDTATRRAYNNAAHEYLLKAEAASIEEARNDSTYLNSTRYMQYRYWRAVIIGRLANSNSHGSIYKNQYRQLYDEFFRFAATQDNALAQEYVPYARLFYARALAADDASDEAKVQLDTLASELLKLSNVPTNVFVRFLKNEYAYRRDGATWKNLVASNFVLSPALKAAVSGVVGAEL
jgi:hypothetical protein